MKKILFKTANIAFQGTHFIHILISHKIFFSAVFMGTYVIPATRGRLEFKYVGTGFANIAPARSFKVWSILIKSLPRGIDKRYL